MLAHVMQENGAQGLVTEAAYHQPRPKPIATSTDFSSATVDIILLPSSSQGGSLDPQGTRQNLASL